MGLLRKRPTQPAAPPPTIAESLDKLVQSAGQPSLFAHSDFVKQVDCARCGAPKQLPSRTAYLYCDHCGALVDYDFRLANSGTNAGLTNTVYHQLVAPLRLDLTRAQAIGDAGRYRELIRGVFAEWIRQCPQAVSPRAQNDPEFRDAMVAYLAECAVRKDLDPTLAPLDHSLSAATAALRRIPTANGAWLVTEGIWQVAAEFRRLMEQTYQRLGASGVLAMDPDEAPPGVPLRMEYSTFCQGWLPHLRPADGERLLAMFGLTGEYKKVSVTGIQTRQCGGCGAELATLPGAQAVVCESCGCKLDIAGGETACRTCGAPLSSAWASARSSAPTVTPAPIGSDEAVPRQRIGPAGSAHRSSGIPQVELAWSIMSHSIPFNLSEPLNEAGDSADRLATKSEIDIVGADLGPGFSARWCRERTGTGGAGEDRLGGERDRLSVGRRCQGWFCTAPAWPGNLG